MSLADIMGCCCCCLLRCWGEEMDANLKRNGIVNWKTINDVQDIDLTITLPLLVHSVNDAHRLDVYIYI